jgi:hypothetical protein
MHLNKVLIDIEFNICLIFNMTRYVESKIFFQRPEFQTIAVT